MDLENSIEEDIEKKISWKKRINLRNHENYKTSPGHHRRDELEAKMQDMATSIQSIRYFGGFRSKVVINLCV